MVVTSEAQRVLWGGAHSERYIRKNPGHNPSRMGQFFLWQVVGAMPPAGAGADQNAGFNKNIRGATPGLSEQEGSPFSHHTLPQPMLSDTLIFSTLGRHC